MFDVADGDVEEEVVFAGDVEDFDDFGEGVGQFSEALDGREPLVAEADGDDGAEADAERGGIDIGVKATENAVVDELADAVAAGRLRQAYARGELLVAEPRILLQRGHDSAIDLVKGCHRS